jgi:hypothetical protein
MSLYDQVHGLSRRVDSISTGPAPQAQPERRPQDFFEPQLPPPDHTEEILQEIAQLRRELDQRLLGLTPEVKVDMSTYAPLAVVKKIAMNFQTSVEDFDAQIAAIKDFLKNLVSRNDLEAMMERLQAPAVKAEGETAGGRCAIRCLLCGKAANGVTGMITESDLARLLGTPPQMGVRGSYGDGYVLTYGKDTVRPKKRSSLKNPLPPINPPVNVKM